MGGVGENIEKLEAIESAVLNQAKVWFFPAGFLELIVESADEMVVDAHDGVGVGGVDEIGVVVVPLKGLFAMERLAEEK